MPLQELLETVTFFSVRNGDTSARDRTMTPHSSGVCCRTFAAAIGLALVMGGTALASDPEDAKTTAQEAEAADPWAFPETLMPEPADRNAVPLWFARDSVPTLEDLQAMESHIRDLIARVAPATVAVRVGDAIGSGIVISEDGIVLTAAHVCAEPGRTVRVTFPDGRRAEGKTFGTNHRSDSGLMKIRGDGPWPHVSVGDLAAVDLGDWVLALGHPGGFERDRSVVARLGRVIRLGPGMMRTDCAIIGGDSGGPLFDMHGRVIAVHSRISESTTENYHVPIHSYAASWERLVKGDNWGGRGWRRAYVGLRGSDDPKGFRVEWVAEDGPAFQAGLKEGDVVARIDDLEVSSYGAFREYVGALEPGAEVTLRLWRNDEELSLTFKVERWRRRR